MNRSPLKPDAAADSTAGQKLDPADYFDPGEIAILRAYFGLEPRPGDPPLSQLYEPEESEEYESEPFPGEDDEPRVLHAAPIRLQHIPDDGPINELSEAVARICLGEVQEQLPQFWDPKYGPARLRFPTPARQRPLKPELLLEINWDSPMPGIDWPESYFVTFIPGFERFVVTASVDSQQNYGVLDVAAGWFPASESVLDGSRRILLDWWRDYAENETPAWAEQYGCGVIDYDEGERMRALVWPDEQDTEAED